MTEREKMTIGKIYDPSDKELERDRMHAHKLCKDYNDTYETDVEIRKAIMNQLLPDCGEGTYILGPMQFDYGYNTHFGKKCFVNFNLMVLDTCSITIGDNVFFGPGCSLLTPLHPFIPEERNMQVREDGSLYDLEYGAPITIGSNCWFGGNVTVCGGVTIGEGCVIGAGSVVTRDIPANTLAAGNPCRPIREITEKDSVYLKKELF